MANTDWKEILSNIDWRQTRINELQKQNKELRELLKDIHGDLLERGKKDSQGVTVANISHSIWQRIWDEMYRE